MLLCVYSISWMILKTGAYGAEALAYLETMKQLTETCMVAFPKCKLGII